MGAVAAIVLAAGASRRLGSPKQLARLGAETLLERAVKVSLEAGLRPVYGVVGAGFPLDATPAGMIRVVNRETAEGMASSIRGGVRAVELERVVEFEKDACVGAVILACDQPAVTARHLEQLAAGKGEVVASRYAGRKGVPAYFPARVFAELLALHGDVGARELLREARSLDLPGGELDVDTVEDLERARELYGR